MKPLLPTADTIAPYLQRIDAARWYTNAGPLLREFEQRLAQHFAVPATQLAVVCNGTTALSALLLAAGTKPGGRCLLPAWTFVASAAAVWAANLTPHFVDVSPATWMLDPEALLRRTDLDDVGAVMVVSAFGAPVDAQAWDAFTARTGIPVIIDGAASFDTVARVPAARPGKSATMISLHATKVFGIGEGAVVLSTDEALVHRFRQVCNFGVWGSPEGQVLGYNGKLSEYHAAVGLAALDAWQPRRAALASLTAKYRSALARIARVELLPGYGEDWISCYCNVAVDDAATIVDRLDYVGIDTRRWWRHGVHAQRAYKDFSRDDLPVTESLARRVFGLPFFHDISDVQFARVISAFTTAVGGPP
jgi:dTDP-4-amino-4,6-dideoxygalactose transaminase